MTNTIRCQVFWVQRRFKLSECMAYLVDVTKRHAGGDASPAQPDHQGLKSDRPLFILAGNLTVSAAGEAAETHRKQKCY